MKIQTLKADMMIPQAQKMALQKQNKAKNAKMMQSVRIGNMKDIKKELDKNVEKEEADQIKE